MNQFKKSESVTYTHISLLFSTSFPFISPQSIEQGSLCNAVGSHESSILFIVLRVWGFPGDSVVKNPPAKAGAAVLIPGLGRCPWRRKRQSTPVLLPGKSHGQRSLVGYCSWGRIRIGHDLATKRGQLRVCVCQSQPANPSHAPPPLYLAF